MSIPGLVLLLFVLAALELAASKFDWIPWRRGRKRRMATGLAAEELFSFLYATKRAELDQRDTELVMPQLEEDGAPPRNRIDLDHGTAVLDLSGRERGS
ncbi:hypothetical protein B0I33_11330 [Prauserella shujinwangii]|uniref:Uncharacterized protein n=1 Tax=Prauserella shujinwangii TaxID=1453103 RepID=A0A2T0LLG2_9PSEU|nr:DUF6191 domain-containing protein [Prauserella shujinwangii]PRX43867.1 hypothetical protein B0I33_11330 [Prauserella shujinwangii]